MSDDLGAVRFGDLAAVQYHGLAGISRSCLDAVRRILSFGERADLAILLTSGGRHAFLLLSARHGDIAIKSGFSSGYSGEGPAALADALNCLTAANIEIEEVEAPAQLLDRLDLSAMTMADLDLIQRRPDIRPSRWYDYVYAVRGDDVERNRAWSSYPEVMPWHSIDSRLHDLAATFAESPDRAILEGFRRLEDIVRKRIGSREHGAKLFSIAFAGDKPALQWHERLATTELQFEMADDLQHAPDGGMPELIDRGEQIGRAQLFTGAYQAFRNPRAHRQLDMPGHDALSEFLVLNQLFLFEGAAVVTLESGIGE